MICLNGSSFDFSDGNSSGLSKCISIMASPKFSHSSDAISLISSGVYILVFFIDVLVDTFVKIGSDIELAAGKKLVGRLKDLNHNFMRTFATTRKDNLNPPLFLYH